MCQRKELHSGRWVGGGGEDRHPGLPQSNRSIARPQRKMKKKIKAGTSWAGESKNLSRVWMIQVA